MTAQDYIQAKLDELQQPLELEKPASKEELAETIFKYLMSKKFRKYSAKPELVEHINNAIRLNIDKHEPINLTFTQGSYKLWRLKESPEVDWAELFTLMYYTNWLKPICAVYKPGVWMDFFTDDLILPKINNLSIEEVKAYRVSFQRLIDWLKTYQPGNLKMTVTGVSDQFASPDEFAQKLEQDVIRHKKTLPGDLPVLTEERIATVELNARPTHEQLKDPLWKEKTTLIHDAYLAYTKAETGYHNQPTKIKVFSQPLPSGMFLAPGTTKDSIAKHWAGVGALQPRDDSYRQLVLSPKQLENSEYKFEPINIQGLTGKNFQQVRVLK